MTFRGFAVSALTIASFLPVSGIAQEKWIDASPAVYYPTAESATPVTRVVYHRRYRRAAYSHRRQARRRTAVRVGGGAAAGAAIGALAGGGKGAAIGAIAGGGAGAAYDAHERHNGR